MTEDIQLRLPPDKAASSDELYKVLSGKVRKGKINDYRIIRRSVDARKRPVMINLTVRVATGDTITVDPIEQPIKFQIVDKDSPEIVIVGAGPAGLFAALESLRLGIRPIVIERGKDVDSRRIDLATISRDKKVNPDSNYCFGEGGAGAYSDGKLFTRSKKRGNIEEVLQILVQNGASPDILIESHPHIGSDRLPHVIKNIRETIIANGGEVRFETKMTGLKIKDSLVVSVLTDKGDIPCKGVILAIGHSAHDTVKVLHRLKLPMESKGIAIGVRLEHPQKIIDRIQYHSSEGRGKWLPAAEYSFVTQVDGRGVYSFCMCPGGVVVPAASAEGEMVVNGMSASARSGKWANSGMVVELHPGDIQSEVNDDELSMLRVQESLEKQFYEASGNSIVAPAQRMTDFIKSKKSSTLPPTSYVPGIKSLDFNKLLPEFISRRLAEGFKEFDRKAPGFMTPEAIMIGLESRTSSPVRMLRDPESMASPMLSNLYPAGEGAGYAGGIVSAAIDGMRCAKSLAESLKNKS